MCIRTRSRARARLGWEPLKVLFERIAVPMAAESAKGCWYRNWRTVALDVATLDVPDSASNAAAFGYPAASRGKSAFPQIRFAVLCETGVHAAFACEMGTCSTGEAELARQVLGRLQAGMLLLADRGFLSYDLWNESKATGADLVWRVSASWGLPVETMLDDGSWISRIQPPRARRKKEPDVRVRVVAYKLEGSSKAYRLVTSILDPNDAPAQELATLYHERWEIESVFDEIKTHLKGPKVVVRSKTPELVRQEFWGMMIAHRALRDLMYEAASEKGWDPDDVSLVHAIRIVRRTMSGAAALPP